MHQTGQLVFYADDFRDGFRHRPEKNILTRPELEHPTVTQDADAIRQRESFGAIMRNKHRRHAGFLDDALKVAQQLFTAGRIYGGEWLVQKQELRFERERASQTRSLSFAAR